MINRSKMKEDSILSTKDVYKYIQFGLSKVVSGLCEKDSFEQKNHCFKEVFKINKAESYLNSSDSMKINNYYYLNNREKYFFVLNTLLDIIPFYTDTYDLLGELTEKDKEDLYTIQLDHCNNITKTYLMLDEVNGFIKIGKSKKPIYRERTLQSEKPTIKLIHIIYEDIESELHEKYKEYRYRGEWFKLPESKVDEIIYSNNSPF